MMNSTTQSIELITVADKTEGSVQVFDLVKKHMNSQTVLWLSGGSSPKTLYTRLAEETDSMFAAAALVDERYGIPQHEDSNELMIQETGIVESLEEKGISFYPILSLTSTTLPTGRQVLNLADTAAQYNAVIAKLISRYDRHCLVMGLGADAHTAGIFADAPSSDDYVLGYTTELNPFHQRITITPYTLEVLADKGATMVILAFGEDKKDAIQRVLQHDSSGSAVPAAQYSQLTARGARVYLVTDQDI